MLDKQALKHFLGRMLSEREDQYPWEDTAFKDAMILIVDDSRTIVYAVKKMLQPVGYQPIMAYDGEQAVEAAIKWEPDLILMDIVMPRMNGFEATRLLGTNSITADIPIVIISGADRVTDRRWAARLGAKGFLTKPLQRQTMLTTIHNVLEDTQRSKERESRQQGFSSFDQYGRI
jgi:twitching motility two-component system response regulator PilH